MLCEAENRESANNRETLSVVATCKRKKRKRSEQRKGRECKEECADIVLWNLPRTLEVVLDTNPLHLHLNKLSHSRYCCYEIHTDVILSETLAFLPKS